MCKGPDVGVCLDWPEAQWVWNGGSKGRVVGGGVGGNGEPVHTGSLGCSMILGFCLEGDGRCSVLAEEG